MIVPLMNASVSTLVGMSGLTGAVGTGLIFVSGAVGKVRNRAGFRRVVGNYRILPDLFIASVALILPWVELLIGAGLLAGIRVVALPAAMLLATFAVAIGINLGRGRASIDCGCSLGAGRNPIHGGMVWRNLVLAALVSFRLAPAPASGLAITMSAVAAGLAIVILIHLQDSIVLLTRSPLVPARAR